MFKIFNKKTHYNDYNSNSSYDVFGGKDINWDRLINNIPNKSIIRQLGDYLKFGIKVKNKVLK